MTYLMVDKFEELLGEIKYNREQRKHWAARWESTMPRKADMECHSYHQKDPFTRTAGTHSGNRQSQPSQ